MERRTSLTKTGVLRNVVGIASACLWFGATLHAQQPVNISLGQTINGTLEASDARSRAGDGSFADNYQLTIASAQAVTIELRSVVFDTFLIVVSNSEALVGSDDDGAGGTDSRIQLTLQSGTYIIEASSFTPGDSGAYTLSVTGSGGTTPPPTSANISVGQTVNGTLEASDARTRAGDGSFADNYQLTIASAQTVTIELRSAVFDTFLIVVSNSEALVGSDDDGAGGTDSRIQLTLQPGTYIIEASSFRPGDSGAYTLSVTGSGTAPPPTPANISVGQTVNGTLEASDARTRAGDGSFADNYRLTLGAAQTVIIEMRSAAFDTFLIVVDGAETFVDSDDDGAGGSDSRLQLTLQAGSYTIETTSFRPGVSGAYTLSITSGTAAPPPAITQDGIVSSASFRGGSVSPGEILSFFGSNIGPDQLLTFAINSATGRLATQLGSTRILFDGVPAPILFVSRNQAGAIAPFALAGRASTSVQFEVGGQRSNPVTLSVTPTKPAIFSAGQTGTGQGAVLNQNFSINSASNRAAPGSVIQIFMTGGGQTSPAGVDGALVRSTAPFPVLTATVTVTIGGQNATVAYQGAAPGLLYGLIQVNAIVPNVGAGAAVPLEVNIGGAASQLGITIAIQSGATAASL